MRAPQLKGPFGWISFQSSHAPSNAGTAHINIESQPGTSRASIQIATASISTAKNFFTVSIHAPARGSSRPAEVPIRISGAPMPRDMTNSALPPRNTSPV